jgi:hypothetical protein
MQGCGIEGGYIFRGFRVLGMVRVGLVLGILSLPRTPGIAIGLPRMPGKGVQKGLAAGENRNGKQQKT